MRASPISAWAALSLLGAPSWSLAAFPDCVSGPLAKIAVCDPKAAPADRAAALVKAMTLGEKLANLVK